jgi:surfactin family lipopeptide synthetase A
MARLWEQVLDVRPIGRNDDFFALGGHSLLAVRLLSQLQKHFARSFPLAALFQHPTIARFGEMLRQQRDTSAWSPLVPLQPAGQNRPFFCVHPTGGDVVGYRELAALIGSHQPFYGLQAPQLADVGDNDLTIEEMAALYVAAMRSVQPEGPYMIGGWSLGGLIAFEMAQQLHRAGETVALLAVIDSRPPATLGDMDQITDGTVLFGLVKEQALQLGKTLDLSLADLERLEPDAQLTTVLEAAKAINLDFQTELDWVRRFVLGFRARTRSSHAYQPRVYPGRIVLFKTISGDDELNEVRRLAGQDLIDPTYGWDALSTEPITIQVIPGYHETMLQAPYVQALADQLRALLDQAQALIPQSQV